MSDTFVIGDVQGCYTQLRQLVEKIDAISPQAQLLFAGDLVNRGPESLETLRYVRSLGERADSVLGNHDLHLLAVAHVVKQTHRSDTLDTILAADDSQELLDWLRHRPLAIDCGNRQLLVHAGVFPNWSFDQCLTLAHEIEATLRGSEFVDLLRDMYGNQPDLWQDDLQGINRQRCIINAFTRMRFCHHDGRMDFELKEGSDQAPAHLLPWFDLAQRQTQNETVIFGHWSTLGLVLRPNLISLDTGCVWGGKLSAVRLSDRLLIQVDSPQHMAPF